MEAGAEVGRGERLKRVDVYTFCLNQEDNQAVKLRTWKQKDIH